ncbi:MAG TPA: RDD family protein [Candidatus Limnocylindria bacterium]|nr:RDD family protein [Candidatus Limnocylindria bacterium]
MPGTSLRFADASFNQRFDAYQIDGLIILVPSLFVFLRILFDANLDVFALGGVWAVIWYVYFAGFWWLGHGQTPGMRLRKIRVVRRDNGGDPGFVRSFLRITGLFFGLLLGIVQFGFLLNREALAAHDRLAGTRVVRTAR